MSRILLFCLDRMPSSKVLLAAFAELLGTFILVAVGSASVAQSQLTNDVKDDFFITNWGWALGVMLGFLVSAKASGGHLNPAISCALALFGKLSWKRMIVYWFAQYLGALIASAVTLGIYYEAILQGKVDGEFRIHKNYSDPGTAAIFANYPAAASHPSVISTLAEETLATAFFVLVICVVTDKSLSNISHSMQALYIGFALLAMGIAYGSMSGYALNPARDLSPRLVTLLGWWGPSVFSFRGYNWFWIFIVGPHFGAIVGVGLYQILVKLSNVNQRIQGCNIEHHSCCPICSNRIRSVADAKLNQSEKYVPYNEHLIL